ALVVWALGVEKVNKLFPPVVTGPMIIVIGLTLSPVAIQMASTNWSIAIAVIITVILVSAFLKGFWSLIPVLTGVVVGYIIALISGQVDISPLQQTAWLSLPKFILPKFDWAAVTIIAPVSIATFMEHIGDITTNGAVVGKNFFKHPGLHRTLIGDGLATSLAGLLGGPANTTYSENTGVLALTKVYDPRVLRGAAFLAMVVAFVSKFGALLRTIPSCVIGGISLILFGMIASVGIRTLVNAKVDFSKAKNLLVASLILTIGIGGASLKIGPVELKGLSLAAIVGILANLLIVERKEE
ncbi:MAG: solute carrier family 23 protein, partial [Pseudothermotoga sp.]